MGESTTALEQFRQQWREEVNARSKILKRGSTQEPVPSSSSSQLPSTGNPLYQRRPAQYSAAPAGDEDDGDDSTQVNKASAIISGIDALNIRGVDEDDFTSREASEPESALEHFQRAVEKENQGNLGDSLTHYRKAYRLDAKVDQSYRNRILPVVSKPADTNPSNASPAIPSTAHHSSKEPNRLLTLNELITSFSGLPILGAEPIIEGDRPPPCPIKDLPYEVLYELLWHTAIVDPAVLVRLSLVCKKLAYHVFSENTIWKRVALGYEFGMESQIFNFSTNLQGHEIIERSLSSDVANPKWDENSFSDYKDWRDVFHSHPRIRFTGVYISTVNYTRAGGASASQVTWNSPIHIVTYYRYIRFFRDGTVISLLTTNEPVDVVHHLTHENINLVRYQGKDHQHPLNFTSSAAALVAPKESSHVSGPPPSAQHLMKHALRGRWRMCPPSNSTPSVSEIATNGATAAGDLHIETEGAGPRYMYTMHLGLKSSSKAPNAVKNNKLQWKGFWSYNQLTNDWAEFQLRNDKAFYFSRVKSYGLGY